jgi:hypothetical protein
MQSGQQRCTWVVDQSADSHASAARDQAALNRFDTPGLLAALGLLASAALGAIPRATFARSRPLKATFPPTCWLQDVIGSEIVRAAQPRTRPARRSAQAWTALGNLARAMGAETELVGLLTTSRRELALASLQLELLQKSLAMSTVSCATRKGDLGRSAASRVAPGNGCVGHRAAFAYQPLPADRSHALAFARMESVSAHMVCAPVLRRGRASCSLAGAH